MTRKLYVKSYGCQMNVYDSHRMADTLAPAGFTETATPDDADLIILNTCHIREKAAEKVYSELGRMRALKEDAATQGRDVTIADVAQLVKETVGFDGDIVFDTSKPDGTPRKLLDVSRLFALGWRPRIDLRTGLAETYAWFQQNVDAGRSATVNV